MVRTRAQYEHSVTNKKQKAPGTPGSEFDVGPVVTGATCKSWAKPSGS